MKRLLIMLLAGVSLALPATALAMQYAPTVAGSKFASRTVTGSCTVTRSRLAGTATLRCPGNGSATVRYPFTLPSNCGPSVSPWADATGDPSYGATQKAGKVILWVRTGANTRVVISSVSLRYLCS